MGLEPCVHTFKHQLKHFQTSIENTDFLWVCAKFCKSIQVVANFTFGMIGSEMGHLLEHLELYGKFTNNDETWHMLKGNIAATWLKI